MAQDICNVHRRRVLLENIELYNDFKIALIRDKPMFYFILTVRIPLEYDIEYCAAAAEVGAGEALLIANLSGFEPAVASLTNY